MGDLKRAFQILSKKLCTNLRKGGADFSMFLRFLYFQGTDKENLYILLEYWRDGKQLFHMVFGRSRLKVRHDNECRKYQDVRVAVIQPSLRENKRL